MNTTTLKHPATQKISFSSRDCRKAGKDLLKLRKTWLSSSGNALSAKNRLQSLCDMRKILHLGRDKSHKLSEFIHQDHTW